MSNPFSGITKHIPILGKNQEARERAAAALSEIEQYNEVLPRKLDEPLLGQKARILPATEPGHPAKLYVAEKLFAYNAFSQNKFKDKIKVVSSAEEVVCKTANVKDRVIIADCEENVFALIIQSIHLTSQSYTIYGIEPIFPRQKPSPHRYENHNLFAWAKVTALSKKSLSVDVCDERGFEAEVYTLERVDAGSQGHLFGSKPVLVKKYGQAAAILRQGEFHDGISGPVWSGTVAPGVDPAMLIGFIAILDTQSV